jgi:hypothetical protein
MTDSAPQLEIQSPSDDEMRVLTFTDGAIMSQAMSMETMFANELDYQSGASGNTFAFEVWSNAAYGQFGITREIADVIYSSSMIARRAIETIPDKAWSLLESWEPPEKKNKPASNSLMRIWRKKLLSPFIEAACMARKYQDAYVILFWDDTSDLSKPFNPEAASELVGAVARSRWSVLPTNGIPGSCDSYRMTSAYNDPVLPNGVKGRDGVPLGEVHSSRVIHVPGILIDNEQKRYRQGYNMSLLSYLQEPLEKWITTQQAGIGMLQSHSMFKLGLKGLAWKTQNKDVQSLGRRFKSIFQGIKLMGGLIHDQDQETADFSSRSYGGVDNLIKQLESYLVNASDTPKDFLLMSGDGAFSETGTGSRYALASIVEKYHRTHVSPVVETLFGLLASVYFPDLDEKYLEECEPVYKSALMMTRAEEADIQFKHAQSATLYLNSAVPVLNAESVLTHWENGHYNDEITLTGKLPPEPPALGAAAQEGAGKEMAKAAANSSRGAYTAQKTSKKG